MPLGIVLKGEQKYEEMIEVLTHLNKYVPTVSSMESFSVQGEEPVEVTKDLFHNIAIGKCFWTMDIVLLHCNIINFLAIFHRRR